MKHIFILLLVLLSVLLIGCNDKESDFSETIVVTTPDDDTVNQKDEEIDDSIETDDDLILDKTDDVINEPQEMPEYIVETSEDDNKEVSSEEPFSTPDNGTADYIRVEEIELTTYNVTLNIGEKKMPIVTMFPRNATDKGENWESSDIKVATVDNLGNIKAVSAGECTVTVTSVDNSEVSATVSVTVVNPEPKPQQENNEKIECTYIDGILVVNKTYPLPPDYAPGWETEASGPLWEMIAAAKEDGVELWMKSGYRSYYDQKYIYNGYVKRDGQEEADKYSARPGHSEHQTGLAYDLNSLDVEFGDTPEGIWIAENCYKYGFILRYPKDKEEITGYMYEPWHVRYVGVEKAKEIFESGLCLEEFLNITSVYAE